MFDSKSFSLIDSVKVANCDYCEINSKGNLLLVQTNGEWYAYYKHNALKRKKNDEIGIKCSTLKSSGYKDITLWNTDTIIDKRFSISTDYEGMHLTDLSGEQTNWHIIEENYYVSILAACQNKHFVIASLNSRYDSSSMTAIMDFVSGAVIKQIHDHDGNKAYYFNEKSQKIAVVEKGDIVEIVDFPSFNNLVSLCSKATDGMKLDRMARRKFYLE